VSLYQLFVGYPPGPLADSEAGPARLELGYGPGVAELEMPPPILELGSPPGELEEMPPVGVQNGPP
jgi:hypothetical protein